MPRLLIVTAVAAERDAVLSALPAEPAEGQLAGLPVLRAATPAGLVDVVAGGVGPVAAALSAAALLAAAGYDLVIAAGIGGGFPPVQPAGLAVADRVTFADLGAELADGGFAALPELGLGEVSLPADPAVARLLAERTGAVTGTVLTVSTVTGSRSRAERLRRTHPQAVAEGMEGAGVALAAQRAGIPFGEVRAVSNPVGPRDRASWRLAEALAALAGGFARLLAEPLTDPNP
ncbi:MAG TPA: futalosine hydrolase [Jatrophihabitans sp.]|nr:futalosine hydrolase [Jatrophihabitans sp.]